MNIEIIKDYLDKMPIKDICIKHNINATSIYAVLRKNNIPVERGKGSQRKEEQALKAIAEYNQCKKVGWRELSKKYDVSLQAIYKYKRGIK